MDNHGTFGAGLIGDLIGRYSVGVVKALLLDRTTRRGIIWATDVYTGLGAGYAPEDEITLPLITGARGDVIKPRVRKLLDERLARTKSHAEVMTPVWICRMMLDFADADLADKPWRDRIDERRLEITCGEAPFITTRYDTTTGEEIPLKDRTGILDRKLELAAANAEDDEEFLKWAFRALESTYGYEWQGDNLLIARLNALMTFADAVRERLRRGPEYEEALKAAKIISWNIWQMDGLRGTVPLGAPFEAQITFDSFSGAAAAEPEKCRVFNWRRKRSQTYISLKGDKMSKFDFIIGNPPYQEETDSNSSRTLPLYDKFMEEAYKCGKKVELITPARFLFNSGFTSKEWNNRRLNDEHFKVLYYEADSSKVFSNVDLKGGVAVTYRDEDASFGAIGMFIPSQELRSISDKVVKHIGFIGLNTIICPRDLLHYSEKFFTDNPEYRSMNNNNNVVNTNAFDKFPVVFKEQEFADSVPVIGRSKNERVTRFISSEYLELNDFINVYKLIIPEVNGSGKFGEAMASSVFGDYGTAFTDTFLCIGKFATKFEVTATSKYIQTKFARGMLGVLKKTQHNTAEKWKYVPLQDFTSTSDIDWSRSVEDIDRQLYKKYGLSDEEIGFIETKVRAM